MTTKTSAAVNFSTEERAAMKDHARELKTAARRGGKATKADGTADVLAKIAAMQPADRVLAERIHAIVTAEAPDLAPKTWYGMPAYARDGKVVCFFQSAEKFKARYATLGFNDTARLDEGTMWPVTYALTTLTAADEERIADLVRAAAA
ncbi:DUF1801 domain-containing protein [Nocardia sp. BSTN01]|uniref:iron chaperone n=1 Tax=Nocardia sp. BSTN01 TaxID=2783665 RepID=UPI00188FC622|nr:DUF1801 domain-containing protein [Nocardia sp. BSTN01]MBF4995604.1 DUF1801 domain-containing protein [Nocardia sp. BSTN01]